MNTANSGQNFLDAENNNVLKNNNKVNLNALSTPSEIETVMPPPSYSSIDFLSPLPPSTSSTSLPPNCHNNFYNSIFHSNSKSPNLHNFISPAVGGAADFSCYFPGQASPPTFVCSPAKSPLLLTSSVPSTSLISTTSSTGLNDLTSIKASYSSPVTPNPSSAAPSRVECNIKLTPSSPNNSSPVIDVAADKTNKQGPQQENSEKLFGQVYLHDEAEVDNEEDNDDGDDDFDDTIDEDNSNKLGKTDHSIFTPPQIEQYLLTAKDCSNKNHVNRSKGRSLLHRLASFAAAASNSNNFTPCVSPNRQLEKIAKRSFRLSSTELKQTSLLMEILKLNSISEEKQQQQLDQPTESESNKTPPPITSASHMPASQFLYSQLMQQTSPLLILDYSSQNKNHNSNVFNYDSNNNTNNSNSEQNDCRLIDKLGTNIEANKDMEAKECNAVKAEAVTSKEEEPSSPSSFACDEATSGATKVLELWHEQLKVLTQAHICLEQFIEINHEMQLIFDESKLQQTNFNEGFNNLRDQKSFIETIMGKLQFLFRRCEDARQFFLRTSFKQMGEGTSSDSQAETLKYTPEGHDDVKPLSRAKDEQDSMAIKRETVEKSEVDLDSKEKINIAKNMWQPYVNDTGNKSAVEKQEDKQESHYGSQIRSPVCFWHPKNQGFNLNEKALTAAEVILECAALNHKDQIATDARDVKKELNTTDNNHMRTFELSSPTSTPSPTATTLPHTHSSPQRPSSYLQTLSTSSSPPVSATAAGHSHTDDAPALNMLMADCGTSSFLEALSNRALSNLAPTSTNIASSTIPPISTSNSSSNRRKANKNEIINSPANSPLTTLSTTSSYASSPPINNSQIYSAHASAAAAVAALQEKALSDMFKARFNALTAAAVINAATASANAAAAVSAATNTNNSGNPTSTTISSEGPYDLSIGSKFKKM